VIWSENLGGYTRDCNFRDPGITSFGEVAKTLKLEGRGNDVNEYASFVSIEDM